MSRISTITYEMVEDTCQKLLEAGEKPSIRKIRECTGGSLSTILEHYQRWQKERTLTPPGDPELSEPFRRAVLVEIGRATESVRQNLNQQLAIAKDQVQEMRGLLMESELKNAELVETISTQQQTSAQNILGLEKELAAAKALVEAAHQREIALQNTLDNLRNQLHEAELKTAVFETRFQEQEKQLQRLEDKPKRA